MTDEGTEDNRGTEHSGADSGEDPGTTGPGADQPSGAGGYDRRVEEWILRLRDEAEQRAPEVLSELAATAKSVAAYLEDVADQVRAKQKQEATEPDPPGNPESASPELGGLPEQPAEPDRTSTS